MHSTVVFLCAPFITFKQTINDMQRILFLLLSVVVASGFIVAQTRIEMPVKQNPPFEVSVSEVILDFTAPSMTLGGDVVATGGSGSYIYRWYNGEKEIGTDATLVITEPGEYKLDIKDACDCLNTVIFSVKSASVEGVETEGFALYPNPVKDKLTIKAGEIDLRQVNIVPVSGRLLLVAIDFDQKDANEIDLSSLPGGEYIVNCVVGDNNVITRKVIKL